MSATYAPSGRPAWAVTMWCDDVAIYVELPCKGAPPYITKYLKSEGGLARALAVMDAAHRKAAPLQRYTLTKHPLVRTATQAESEQRERAREILKRLKII